MLWNTCVYLEISGKTKIHHHGINLVKWNNSTETEKCWSDVMKFNDTSG